MMRTCDVTPAHRRVQHRGIIDGWRKVVEFTAQNEHYAHRTISSIWATPESNALIRLLHLPKNRMPARLGPVLPSNEVEDSHQRERINHNRAQQR